MVARNASARAALAVLSLALGACSVSLGSEGSPPSAASALPTPVTIVQNTVGPPHSSSADVVKRDLSSVVNVRVSSVNFNGLGGAQRQKAEGSGVIINHNGVILTNDHVVANSLTVKVVFNDSHKPVQGTVLGADPDHDLAVIHVGYDDLNPIRLGSSGQLELGDTVLAIGFPLGLGGPSVTRGIVSGENRSISVPRELLPGTEHLVDLIQTDAAINPGNSGGALINSAGDLVGINTAAAQAGSAENVGFAIAIDNALPIVRQILSRPASRQAWLGVIVASIETSQLAVEAGYPPSARGALIQELVPGGPAQQTALKAGFLIQVVDGHVISSATDLTDTLSGETPSSTVTVKVLTPAGPKTLSVKLGTRPASFTQPSPGGRPSPTR
jgi:S1-C subfamily serine protease